MHIGKRHSHTIKLTLCQLLDLFLHYIMDFFLEHFRSAPASFTKISGTDCDYDVSLAAEGSYTANCVVTDSDGLTASGSAQIVVGLYHGMLLY